MLFVQPFFLLIFLPASLGIYYLARRLFGPVAAVAVIVAASAVFYAPYGQLPAALLLTSLALNLVLGFLLTEVVSNEPARRALLALGLAADFANLATFKYLNQVATLAHLPQPLLGVAIPAGISFYTFHQAVFLVHAYNRQAEVVRFFRKASSVLGALETSLRYAAFVAFFPQLVIGPITFMSELGPQLDRRGLGVLRRRNIQVGVTLVVIGLFKKAVIADRLAPLVDSVYLYLHWHTAISAPQAVLAIVGYYFQLYFDFSGYSDIALGIARLFGLRLPINFDSPLRATGIVDFYRRWHMTLTRVIVLFVFTPLSLWGTRVAVRRGLKDWRGRLIGAWLPYLLNFELIALWHAAKYTFVVFGLVHGVWYICESEVRRSRAFRRFASKTSERLRRLGGVTLTAAPLALTFALFRSDDLRTFKMLCEGLAPRFQPSLLNTGHVGWTVWPALGAVAAIVYLLPNAYEVLRRFNPGFHTFENRSVTPAALRVEWKPNWVWGLLVAAMAAAVLASLNLPAPFLYAGF